MSLFLKNLPSSFYRSIISSRPIFEKTCSVFPSILRPALASATNHDHRKLLTTSLCRGLPIDRYNKRSFRRNDFSKFQFYSKKSAKIKITAGTVHCKIEDGRIHCTIECEDTAWKDGSKDVDVESGDKGVTDKQQKESSQKEKSKTCKSSSKHARKPEVEHKRGSKDAELEKTKQKPGTKEMSKKCKKLHKPDKSSSEKLVSDQELEKTRAHLCKSPKRRPKSSKSEKKAGKSKVQSKDKTDKSCKQCSGKEDDKKVEDTEGGKRTSLMLVPYDPATAGTSEKEKKDDVKFVNVDNCVESPRLDGKLPKVENQKKDLVGGCKCFVNSIRDGLFSKSSSAPKKSKSTPGVTKKKVEIAKSSKSEHCKIDLNPEYCNKEKDKSVDKTKSTAKSSEKEVNKRKTADKTAIRKCTEMSEEKGKDQAKDGECKTQIKRMQQKIKRRSTVKEARRTGSKPRKKSLSREKKKSRDIFVCEPSKSDTEGKSKEGIKEFSPCQHEEIKSALRKPGDDKKKVTSEPPDQSPIMQCIALCLKKSHTNKPLTGKGIPPRDKRPTPDPKASTTSKKSKQVSGDKIEMGQKKKERNRSASGKCSKNKEQKSK